MAPFLECRSIEHLRCQQLCSWSRAAAWPELHTPVPQLPQGNLPGCLDQCSELNRQRTPSFSDAIAISSGCLTPPGLPQGRKSMGCGEKWWWWPRWCSLGWGFQAEEEWCYHWQIILHHLVTAPGFCSRAIFKILPQVTSDFTQAAWLPLEGVKTIFC